MIALTVPFPPTVNHMYGQVGHRKYLKKACHEFRKAVAEEVAYFGKKLGAERVAVFAKLHPPTRRSFDLDNRAKSLLDALQESGVFDNDSQVDVLWLMRGDVVKGGMAKVVIVPADDAVKTYGELTQ